MSPKRGHEGTRAKKGILNVIRGGLASEGETSDAQDVYTYQILGTAQAGKRPREDGEVVISFLKDEMEHVTCPHEDAIVIIADIDGYDAKIVLIDSGQINGCSFPRCSKTYRR